MTALPISDPPSTATIGGPGRERILDEAAARFLAQGYAETSLRQVAAGVGIKAGSLYYHFASKDDLFTAVLAEGMRVMRVAFDEAAATVAAGDLEGEARLHRHVLAHLQTIYDNGPYTAVHVTAFRHAPEAVRAEIVPVRDAYESSWTELLADLLGPGRSARELTMLRLTLFGAMNASVDWFDAERGNLDEFAQIVTHQFWSGAAPTNDQPPSGQKGRS
ncbi:MAG: TetR/AcrR family transcriptional regulator [Acidimicrobiales bacterium]